MTADRRQRRKRRRDHLFVTFVSFCKSPFLSFAGVLVVLGLAGLSLTANATEPAPPKRGGTLRLAVEADPHSLDAAQVFSNEEAMVAFLIFNTLIEPGPDGGFVPGLAEALPTTSADGLTHTFRLRKEVRFSDGQELTADDVVFSFERQFDPKTAAANSSYFRSIVGSREFEEARIQESASPEKAARQPGRRWIEPLVLPGLRATDHHTVEIRLSQPDLAFLNALTAPPAGIVSRAAVERAGRAFASRPIGTGPFMLKEWIRGGRITFVRNPHYFRGNLPRPDDVDVIVNPDWTTWAMMFERGELDLQHYISDPDSLRIRRDARLSPRMHAVTGSSPTFVSLNCELPPFTNRLVRQALNYAVDRDAMVKALLHRAVPATGPLPLTVHGFNRAPFPYTFDPIKARALLAQAGLPNGFRTTLWTARDHAVWVKLALLVQEHLRKVGVTVEVKEVGYTALLESCGRRRTVPMCVWDWVTAFDDPKETLDMLLNGDNITDEGCVNNAFYADPRVQQLFRDAAAEANAGRRLEIYHEIERQVVEDAPWVFLVQLNTQMLVQPWLRNFTARGFWPPVRLEGAWLDR